MNKYIIKYLDYLKFERKLAINTYNSYRDNLKKILTEAKENLAKELEKAQFVH